MLKDHDAFRTLYVIALTLLMLGLIGFGWHYDDTHSYTARTAAEMPGG